MGTEKFQQIVWQIIQDCPGAYNLHDDLRVVGANDEEHDENVKRVMCKLEVGLRLTMINVKLALAA